MNGNGIVCEVGMVWFFYVLVVFWYYECCVGVLCKGIDGEYNIDGGNVIG